MEEAGYFFPFSLKGRGIHTGKEAGIDLQPHKTEGVIFKTGTAEIPARPQFIAPDSSRSTVLQRNSSRIGTVEHLMAALCFFANNAKVQTQGPEIPVMDGSSAPFVQQLKKAGTRECARFFKVAQSFTIEIENSKAEIVPVGWGTEPVYSVFLEYSHNTMGFSECRFSPGVDSFEKEIAPARTYALEEEVESIRRAGLGKGGTLENTLIVGKGGPLNEGGMRFENEPARHKMLDLTGDLALMGKLPAALVTVRRPGHRINHEIVRRLMHQK